MLPHALSERRLQPRARGRAPRGHGRDRARRRRRAARGALLPQPHPLRRPPRLRPARRDLRRPRGGRREAVAEPLALAARRGRGARRAARRDQPRRRVVRAGVPLRRRRQRGRRPRASPQTESHRLIERLMILTNEQVAQLLERQRVPAIYRVHAQPDPPRVERLVEQLHALGVPTPPLRAGPRAARRPASSPREASRLVAPRGRAARARPRGVYIARAPIPQAGLTTASATAATPASAAPPTATSPRRSGATPTSSSTGRCWRRSGRGRRRRGPAEAREVAAHCSRARARVDADRARRRRRLRRLPARARARASAARETEFEGEVSGVIRAGAFVAFGGELGDVYEGFLPARRLRRRALRAERDRDRAGRARVGRERCGSAIRSRSGSTGVDAAARAGRPGAGGGRDG